MGRSVSRQERFAIGHDRPAAACLWIEEALRDARAAEEPISPLAVSGSIKGGYRRQKFCRSAPRWLADDAEGAHCCAGAPAFSHVDAAPREGKTWQESPPCDPTSSQSSPGAMSLRSSRSERRLLRPVSQSPVRILS